MMNYDLLWTVDCGPWTAEMNFFLQFFVKRLAFLKNYRLILRKCLTKTN